MATFTDKLNSLIALLSEESELEDVHFVPAYNINKISRPLDKKLCAVGIRNTYVQSDVYSYEVFELSLYSPKSLGGTECLETVSRICEYLIQKVSGIVSAVTEAVNYDSDIMAFTCELNLKCKAMEIVSYDSEVVSPEETTTVEISGNIFDARYINTYEECDVHFVRRALESTPEAFVRGSTYYRIEIKMFPIAVAQAIEEIDNYDIIFDNMQYTGCKTIEMNTDPARGFVNKLVIYAKERQAIYE